MQAHIQSFHPTISHYRRIDAPNRLYLPSELTQRKMFDLLMDAKPNYCSYGFYCRQTKKLNISFARLGNEKCETCGAFFIHCKATGHSKHSLPNSEGCVACDSWYIHIQAAGKTRSMYTNDKDSPVSNDELAVSIDLQKVS